MNRKSIQSLPINQQQNYQPNIQTLRRDKKFTYCQTQTSKSNLQTSQMQELRKQLQQERQKVKQLQARTIQEQCSVLNHLQVLEHKFQDLAIQKQNLQEELSRVRSQNEWRKKYEKISEQHKHVKGVADAMIEMMHKCQGRQGNLHDAWRWIKKVVWEYQGIKKKALQWKQVYDQVTEAMGKMDQKNN